MRHLLTKMVIGSVGVYAISSFALTAVTSPVHFGSIDVLSTPASVTVSPSGVVTTSNATVLSGTASAGSVTLSGGTPNNVSNFTLSAGPLASGLSVENITTNSASGSSCNTDSNGDCSFNVGATLTISPGVSSTTYSSSSSIIINYP